MSSESNNNFHQEVIELKPKRTKWKFALVFIFIIAVILLLYGFFVQYLSPYARETRRLQQGYEKYLEWERGFKKAMQEDTYGGKTPQETLNLFIEALRKGDIELASRYFMLDTDGSINEEWMNQLRQVQENKQLSQIILWLESAKPDPATPIYDGDYGFIIYSPDNKEIISEINMSFNRYSQVWKIQSL